MVVHAKYLVDTDWAVYYLRGREPYATRLKVYREQGLSISVVSLAELYEGVFRAPDCQNKERALNDFLAGLVVIDVTRDVARTFGRLRAELRSKRE
ncbi:type II toxin-antitoxin system VapC family toxin [Moorellaceae bacterium AZ2]